MRRLIISSLVVPFFALATPVLAQTIKISDADKVACQTDFSTADMSRHYSCGEGGRYYIVLTRLPDGNYLAARPDIRPPAPVQQPVVEAAAPSRAHVPLSVKWRAEVGAELFECWPSDDYHDTCAFVERNASGVRMYSKEEAREFDVRNFASRPLAPQVAQRNEPSLRELVQAQTALDNEKTENQIRLLQAAAKAQTQIQTNQDWGGLGLILGDGIASRIANGRNGYYDNYTRPGDRNYARGCNPIGYTGPIRTC
ncbi:MAG: hypothetical protein JWL82_256 [Parcubacteria group bacterium]|nr:hypothetical protein [Parcubacteria group bacterium]